MHKHDYIFKFDPKWWQTISWINDSQILWRKYAPSGLKELLSGAKLPQQAIVSR